MIAQQWRRAKMGKRQAMRSGRAASSLTEKRRPARLRGNREMQARQGRRLQHLRRSGDGQECDENERWQQGERGMAMQRAEGAGMLLLLLRYAAGFRCGRLIAGRRMANREAGQVRSRREPGHAERRGGKLQIKPENCEAGDKLIAHRRLQTKTAGLRGQSVCCEALHAVVPRANLGQSGRAGQSVTPVSRFRHAL
jgi:hypothetical protein